CPRWEGGRREGDSLHLYLLSEAMTRRKSIQKSAPRGNAGTLPADDRSSVACLRATSRGRRAELAADALAVGVEVRRRPPRRRARGPARPAASAGRRSRPA